MYHLDPVIDAERAIDKTDCREQLIEKETKFLSELMFNAVQNGTPDVPIPTPGCGMSSWPVSQMFFYLADSHAATVFDFYRAAAKGEDVQKRAQDFQRLIANEYGETYAEPSVGDI